MSRRALERDYSAGKSSRIQVDLDRFSAVIPPERNYFRDRKALSGMANRGGQNFFERQLAEALMQLGPAIDAARHGHRQRASAGMYLSLRCWNSSSVSAAGCGRWR